MLSLTILQKCRKEFAKLVGMKRKYVVMLFIVFNGCVQWPY